MTQKTRKLKVTSTLKNHIERVLERRDIQHHFAFENGQWWCEVPISGNRFREVVERAFAEFKSEADGVRYVTHDECKDKLLLKMLTEKFGADGFVVLGSSQT